MIILKNNDIYFDSFKLTVNVDVHKCYPLWGELIVADEYGSLYRSGKIENYTVNCLHKINTEYSVKHFYLDDRVDGCRTLIMLTYDNIAIRMNEEEEFTELKHDVYAIYKFAHTLIFESKEVIMFSKTLIYDPELMTITDISYQSKTIKLLELEEPDYDMTPRITKYSRKYRTKYESVDVQQLKIKKIIDIYAFRYILLDDEGKLYVCDKYNIQHIRTLFRFVDIISCDNTNILLIEGNCAGHENLSGDDIPINELIQELVLNIHESKIRDLTNNSFEQPIQMKSARKI